MQDQIEPVELKERMDRGEKVAIVDVREPAEYTGWNIAGSVNVPLRELMAGAPVPPGPLVTVCLSGGRSEQARRALAARGVAATNLRGGMAAWNSVYDVAPVRADGAEVLQLRRVGKGCLSYMIVSGREAAVIDPTVDVEQYVQAAQRRDARIVAVIDTHAHADHVSGALALARATGATYHAPDEVGPDVPHTSVVEGSVIHVGRTQIRAISTPGHTSASMTYALGELLFTGDTLFVESVGRPDLGQDVRPNASVLWRTLKEKLLPRDPASRILPGHYGDNVALVRGRPIEATLGALRSQLKALAINEPEFVEWVARNTLPKPANFETIKRLNKGSREVEGLDELRWLEAGPNRCAVSG